MKGWAGIATFLVTTGLCAPALGVDINLDCPRLDPKQSEELRARVRLALGTAENPPRSLLVACDDDREWVVWDGPPLELLKVTSEGGLVEAALDTIETRSRQTPTRVDAAELPKTPARPPPPREVPTFEQPAPRPPPERPPDATGGLGVGVEVEAPGKTLGPATGPRLDLGVGWGPIFILLQEAARFGATNSSYSTFYFDLGGGLGYGAPFARGYTFGANLTSGVEFFNVESNTQSSGVVTLGLRAATSIGPAWLVFGLDGRYRMAPQFIGQTVNVTAPRWTGMLVLEVALQVEPLEPKRE